VTGGYVTVELDDGSVVELGPGEAREMFDQLWLLSNREPGAITVAGSIESARARNDFDRRTVELNEQHSSMFRLALANVRRRVPRGLLSLALFLPPYLR
jgi:hypothetical protein